jgi:hypothetical protein
MAWLLDRTSIDRQWECLQVLTCGCHAAGSMLDGARNPLLSVRYRPVPAEEGSLPHTLCNIVVMEYLDKGNLHQVGRPHRLSTSHSLSGRVPGGCVVLW